VKKLMIVILVMGTSISLGTRANVQTTPPQENAQHVISNQDLDLLRKDLRSTRKQLVATNLSLTDTEATKFWPVYDQYVSELIVINDKKFGLIQDYADNWGKLTNEQSLSFIRQWRTRTLPRHSCGRSTFRSCLRYWMEGTQQLSSN
jgi:hypothetical protein